MKMHRWMTAIAARIWSFPAQGQNDVVVNSGEDTLSAIMETVVNGPRN